MNAENRTDGSESVPHSRYEATRRASHGSQQEVADAWAEGKFPTHNVFESGESVLYTGDPTGNRVIRRRGRSGFRNRSSSGSGASDNPKGKGANFYGVQEPDGTGTLWHYNTREAWRTRSGLVVSNHQCWSEGFAHCSVPDDRDAQLPYSALVSVLSDSEFGPYDVEEVIGQPEVRTYEHSDTTHTSYRAQNSVAVLPDGSGVAVGFDPTGRNERYFVTRLSESEVPDTDDAEEVESVLESLLTPEEVATTDLPVVGAHEYAKSRLDEDEAEAHEEAGGRTYRSESRYSDHRLNHQNHRADLLGNVIVRHGEWFFIPTDLTGDDVPEEGCSYAADVLGSHRTVRFHGSRSPLPRECPECQANNIGVNEDGETVCEVCGTDIERSIYVAGELRHATGDHNVIFLGDIWHRAVTHDRDVLMYDESPGGGGGGGGWD